METPLDIVELADVRADAVLLRADNERLRAALQAMLDGEWNAVQLAVRALEPKP